MLRAFSAYYKYVNSGKLVLIILFEIYYKIIHNFRITAYATSLITELLFPVFD